MAGSNPVTRRIRRFVVGMLSTLTAMTMCVPSAMADDFLPIDWYITDMEVKAAWEQNITGQGIKIAVIDDQVVANYPALDDADITYKAIGKNSATTCTTRDGDVMDLKNPTLQAGDRGIYSTHGTEMVSAIVGNGKGYDGLRGMYGVAQRSKILAYTISLSQPGEIGGLNTSSSCGLSIADAINDAVVQKANIISMSIASPGFASGYVEPIVNAMRHGVIVVGARPNNCVSSANDLVGEPLTNNIFPGEITVNAVDRDGNLQSTSDCVDGNVSMLAPGVRVAGYTRTDNKTLPEYAKAGGGTSMATAILSGYLALVLQRWPEATGNQVLQSLVRNTKGNDSGEPRLDPEHKRGFGEVDLPKLLSVDPTRYPDVNPLLAWAYETSEKHEETRGMYTDHSDWKDHSYGQTDPFTTDGSPITVPKEADLVGKEYERQQAAWKRVEECRAEGGSDCMRYSATNTAGDVGAEEVSQAESEVSGVPMWVWFAAGGFGLLVVVGGVVLAVVSARRGRRGSRRGGPSAGAGPLPPQGSYPPSNPYPPQGGVVPSSRSAGPYGAGPYAPRQAPYGQAAPMPLPPQPQAQPPVIPDNQQSSYPYIRR
ncbi:S8/S53 family peptidase [Bifidobacterium sp. LC6]|uniref:S8/S53 family peptidase n=1 Tax=Bifidobacterium colobi TaxID=2809026 RepID=A0ABS5UUX5_9BIFI|nr:S8/S53 family peptidase [Bifidobacterium colobi]MBT1174548.1 S8/S53 family peptidase [Bifidobacterium colobi]